MNDEEKINNLQLNNKNLTEDYIDENAYTDIIDWGLISKTCKGYIGAVDC